jgi:hypothetical protein
MNQYSFVAKVNSLSLCSFLFTGVSKVPWMFVLVSYVFFFWYLRFSMFNGWKVGMLVIESAGGINEDALSIAPN